MGWAAVADWVSDRSNCAHADKGCSGELCVKSEAERWILVSLTLTSGISSLSRTWSVTMVNSLPMIPPFPLPNGEESSASFSPSKILGRSLSVGTANVLIFTHRFDTGCNVSSCKGTKLGAYTQPIDSFPPCIGAITRPTMLDLDHHEE